MNPAAPRSLEASKLGIVGRACELIGLINEGVISKADERLYLLAASASLQVGPHRRCFTPFSSSGGLVARQLSGT